MTVRSARRLVFIMLGLYALALTWPGMVPFNRIEPLVLGLPFVLFWITLWVVLVGGALALLDVAETRAERSAAALAASSTAAPGSPSGDAPGRGYRADTHRPRGED
jgi:hypothetical protein